ncbi:MAG: DNA topoisomerase IB [Cyclobacteriaceae bacterium]|nr:DNA topoisomerase IB [Cyclobacteriaceae bacterium]
MEGIPTLVYISCDEPGFTRSRHGRGFMYKDEKGDKITDQGTLERIKKLVVPPQWKKVWICPDPRGYLQCTGYDAEGRKQYLYHSDWSAYRQEEKFARMLSFGKKLPQISQAYIKDMRRRGWPKRKVQALIVALLDEYYFRIGNRQYARKNNSYGITTIRRKHIQKDTKTLNLRYKAKSGKMRQVKISNPLVAKKIKELSELPGHEVFRYRDEEGNYLCLDSKDVNGYLHEVTGEDFTAKDFRTWGGSKLAIEHYEATLQEMRENPRLKFEPTLVKKVALQLGNTQAVCRKYYIHPRILKYLEEQAPAPLASFIHGNIAMNDALDEYENYLIYLLKKVG